MNCFNFLENKIKNNLGNEIKKLFETDKIPNNITILEKIEKRGKLNYYIRPDQSEYIKLKIEKENKEYYCIICCEISFENNYLSSNPHDDLKIHSHFYINQHQVNNNWNEILEL